MRGVQRDREKAGKRAEPTVKLDAQADLSKHNTQSKSTQKHVYQVWGMDGEVKSGVAMEKELSPLLEAITACFLLLSLPHVAAVAAAAAEVVPTVRI